MSQTKTSPSAETTMSQSKTSPSAKTKTSAETTILPLTEEE
jgi:hypothetical protein